MTADSTTLAGAARQRALETAHRAAVLEQGRIVKQGVAAELAGDPEIAEHYFGQATA